MIPVTKINPDWVVAVGTLGLLVATIVLALIYNHYIGSAACFEDNLDRLKYS